MSREKVNQVIKSVTEEGGKTKMDWVTVSDDEYNTRRAQPGGAAYCRQVDGEIDARAIEKAAQNWRGLEYDTEKLQENIVSSLEGHQRSIVSKMTVKDLYQNRDQFVEEVEEQVDGDLARVRNTLLPSLPALVHRQFRR